nr:redoxin domain-containing protein [Wolbachia endosymbiont of Atemnus politus]
MPNNVNEYPEDSFENMINFAKENRFTFPYLIDSTQEVAKKYDAVSTPDSFSFNAKLNLCYSGRFNDAK